MIFDTATYAVGLDIGSRYIKGVELKKTDEDIQISGFGVMQKDPDLEEVENLERFRQEHPFSVPGVASSISGRSVMIRYVNIPVQKGETLEERLQDQAARYLPFDVSDARMDFERIRVDEGGEEGEQEERDENENEDEDEGDQRVLLVAAKRSTVKNHADQLEEAGYLPNIVDVDALALGNAYWMALSQGGGFENENVGLVDIGATRTVVHVMSGINSLFAREFRMGGDELTSAIATRLGVTNEEAEQIKLDPDHDQEEIQKAARDKLDSICHEVHLSFDYFETEYSRGVDRVLVSGGSSRIPGLKEQMTETLDKEPVLWNPVEDIPRVMEPEQIEQLNEQSRYLAIATGLASRIQADW